MTAGGAGASGAVILKNVFNESNALSGTSALGTSTVHTGLSSNTLSSSSGLECSATYVRADASLSLSVSSNLSSDYIYRLESLYPSSYYMGLITSEYQSSTKFLLLLRAILEITDDATLFLERFYQYFDIDAAIGDQLDVIGDIVGQKRIVDFQPSNSVSPVLDDHTYRILLKAVIGTNHWDGRLTSLYDLWNDIMPNGMISIIDNEDMTALITMAGDFSSILLDLIEHGYIVPRPQGVLYTYAFSQMPYFGFDKNDNYLAGFDTGHCV